MDLLALPASGIATIVVGVGLLILGYLIKVQEWTFLLAGHDPTSVTNESALADLAGGTVLRIGIVVLIFGGLIAAGLTTPMFETVVAVVILIMVGRYIYRARTYAT